MTTGKIVEMVSYHLPHPRFSFVSSFYCHPYAFENAGRNPSGQLEGVIDSTVASEGTAFFSIWGSWPEVDAGVVPTDLIAFEFRARSRDLPTLQVVGIDI